MTMDDPALTDQTAGGIAAAAPQTGDLVIDAAVTDLDAVAASDLDSLAETGEKLHRTLQSRLSDLGS